MTRTWVRWIQQGWAFVSLGVVVACSSGERPDRSKLSSNDLRPLDADAAVSTCSGAGCTCDEEGMTRECGTVKERVSGYLWCSLGTQECRDGSWSPCHGERVVLSKQMLQLRLQGLGASRECGDDNPCSPDCNLFEDDAGGLPLAPDAGLAETDAGLALAPSLGTPNGACTSLELTPETATLELTDLSIAGAQATFTARFIPEDCAGDEAQVVFSVDRPDLAEMSDEGVVTLRAPRAGAIGVRAFAGDLSAAATLQVSVDVNETAEAPPGASSDFGQAGDTEDALFTWLYPYEETVFPPNVQAPLLQWASNLAVEAGWNGGCALRVDGTVRCWGTNWNGEIEDQSGPYVQLSGRYQHFCALTPQGDANCWGDDSYGQAADEVGPFTRVVAGAQHSCALRTDGEISCWGRDNYEQADPPAGPFSTLTAGAYTTCAVRENGDVACWGNTASGQGDVPSGPFIAVSAGTDHVCGIRRDKKLQCWGSNTSGQTDAPSGEFVALDAATYHTCALRLDGAATCWGQNADGQSSTDPGPFIAVTAAGRHSCGMATSGGVRCWGDSSNSRTVGLPGGSVQVGVRYPASGESIFRWTTVVEENQLTFADPPANTIPLPAAPRRRLPELVWKALAATAGTDYFALTVQRHTGDRLLAPVEREVQFSDSPLLGRIVYQSYGTRSVQNVTGTYEDPNQRWGAVLMAYDAQAQSNAVLSGFTSSEGASGTSAGCRGCHSVGAETQFSIVGFDKQRDGLFRPLLDFPDPLDPSGEQPLAATVGQWGGPLWSAIHPTLPLAFTSRGPTPCATRVGEAAGTCPESNFSSASADLQGAGHLLQEAPGGLLGSAWMDTNLDGAYDSAPPNQFLDLSQGSWGEPLPGDVPAELRAAMPVFSPQGDRVAFVHYAGQLTDGLGETHAGDKRSLGMMDFDSESLTLRNFQRLTNVAASACDSRFDASQQCTDVWPTFFPNGNGVVFERQIFSNGSILGSAHSDFGGTRSGCETKDEPACDDGAKGELWWVPLDSDGQPIGTYLLGNANGVVSEDQLVADGDVAAASVAHSAEVEPLLNFEPAVAPRASGTHGWVAFTSRRAYGNVARANPWWSDPRVHPVAFDVPTKKVWVSALYAGATQYDPSSPAFYLEGQELQAANGHPTWVGDACTVAAEERGEETVCRSDADCCGAPETARCEVELPLADPIVRHCITTDVSQCLAQDDVRLCTSDEQCCGAAEGERCASGRCVLPRPLVVYDPATFVRDFQADCPAGKTPQWKFLEWQATLPEGTSIQFAAASAPTRAELEDAANVDLATALPPDTVTWTTWGDDEESSIDAKLAAQGYLSYEWLRVSMTLRPDERRVRTPALSTWRLIYDCSDNL